MTKTQHTLAVIGLLIWIICSFTLEYRGIEGSFHGNYLRQQ